MEVVKLRTKIPTLQDSNKIYEWSSDLADNVSGLAMAHDTQGAVIWWYRKRNVERAMALYRLLV